MRVREAVRDGGGDDDDGLFFPFDPCRLPKTNAAVQTLYREWTHTEESDDDEESSSGESSSGSSSASLAPMSLSTSLRDDDAEAW